MAITPSTWYCRDNSAYPSAVITAGSITGGVLTVTAVTGTLAVGMAIWGSAATIIGIITSLGTGTGGNGTYNMTGSGSTSAPYVAFGLPALGNIGWSNVTPWAASTSFPVGRLIRQSSLGAQFTASTSGSSTTLTVASVASGKITPGMNLILGGFGTGVTITGYGTGTGGTGTYTMNGAQTIASQTMLAMLTPGNERVFVAVSTAGTSGSTEPAWGTVTKGASVSDGTVTWREVTGQPVFNGDAAGHPVWLSLNVVSLGTVVLDTGRARAFICTTAGTTSGSEPTWVTTAGSTTSDGTATWTCLGPVATWAAWAAPAARIQQPLGTAWMPAGAKLLVASDHADVGFLTISTTSNNATLASPITIVSVNPSAMPPTATQTGASMATIGSQASIGLGTSTTALSLYGITLAAGSGAGNVGVTNNCGRLSADHCTFTKGGLTASTSAITFGNFATAGDVLLTAPTFKFGATGDQILLSGRNVIRDIATLLASGSAVPTTLFNASADTVLDVAACDFSPLGSNTLISGSGHSTFVGCKSGSGMVLASSPTVNAQHDFLNCDSAGTQYQRARYGYNGTTTTETTIVRTGGASIEGTAISDKIVTNANAVFSNPFLDIPLMNRNATTGANVTVTVYGLAPAGLPLNDEIWLDVEYPGTAGSPLLSTVTTAKASPIAAGSSVSTDTSSWGGAGTAFKLVATLTAPRPQLAGWLTARVKAAKASATFYIDPVAVLS